MSVEKKYWMQLFANLVNASPVDTRNMVTHITMVELNDCYEITVAAPYATNPKIKKTTVNGFSDYALAVNSRKPHKNWIEKQIQLTQKIVNGRDDYLGGVN